MQQVGQAAGAGFFIWARARETGALPRLFGEVAMVHMIAKSARERQSGLVPWRLALASCVVGYSPTFLSAVVLVDVLVLVHAAFI